MLRIIRITPLFFLFTLAITACTTVAPPPPAPNAQIPWKKREVSLNTLQSWQLSGKIAVQTAQDSGSATVEWSQHDNQYMVSLFGPLGTHGFKLRGQPGKVTMETAEGKHFSAATAEQLLAKHWGFHLPVSNINYWVRGLPVPGIPYQSKSDSSNRLAQLTQQGWNVQYLSYTRSGGFDLPSRMSINSPALKSKIVIYQWKVG